MNTINTKVKNKLINNYSKKHLIFSIETIINSCTFVYVSLSECIHNIKPIMSIKDANDIINRLNKENIGLFQKGLETSIHSIQSIDDVKTYSEWNIYTNEICFVIINSFSCVNNLNNLITLLKNMNLLELNAYNFSEAKMIGLKLMKENTLNDTKKELDKIDKSIQAVYKQYLKYLKTVHSIHKQWFKEYDYYEKLSNKLESNHQLIDFYTMIMKYLMSKVDKDAKAYIMGLLEVLKDKSMSAFIDDDSIFEKQDNVLSNTLQFFNIVSTENGNMTLYDICKKIFNVKNSHLKSLKDNSSTKIMIQMILQELMNMLNVYSTSKKIKYGMIIFYKNNNNVQYEIYKLMKSNTFENIERYNGINKNYINLYNNLKEHIVIETLFNHDMCININIDRFTKRAFIIHTNDMRTCTIQSNFKYSDLSIDYPLIRNIVRNSPSKRIENYNKILNKKIQEKVDPLLQRKYNDFVNLDYSNVLTHDTYKSMIQHIRQDIQLYLQENEVKDNIPFSRLVSFLVDDDIYKVLTNSIIAHYQSKVNIKEKANKENIVDVFLTCLAESEKITKKVKKEVNELLNTRDFTLQDFLEKYFPIILNNNINVRQNIYDKIIEKEYKVNHVKYIKNYEVVTSSLGESR